MRRAAVLAPFLTSAVAEFTVLAPASIAGSYLSSPAQWFGPANRTVRSEAVRVPNGCDPFSTPCTAEKQIAVISHYGCGVERTLMYALQAGCSAALIAGADGVPGPPLSGPVQRSFEIDPDHLRDFVAHMITTYDSTKFDTAFSTGEPVVIRVSRTTAAVDRDPWTRLWRSTGARIILHGLLPLVTLLNTLIVARRMRQFGVCSRSTDASTCCTLSRRGGATDIAKLGLFIEAFSCGVRLVYFSVDPVWSTQLLPKDAIQVMISLPAAAAVAGVALIAASWRSTVRAAQGLTTGVHQDTRLFLAGSVLLLAWDTAAALMRSRNINATAVAISAGVYSALFALSTTAFVVAGRMVVHRLRQAVETSLAIGAPADVHRATVKLVSKVTARILASSLGLLLFVAGTAVMATPLLWRPLVFLSAFSAVSVAYAWQSAFRALAFIPPTSRMRGQIELRHRSLRARPGSTTREEGGKERAQSKASPLSPGPAQSPGSHRWQSLPSSSWKTMDNPMWNADGGGTAPGQPPRAAGSARGSAGVTRGDGGGPASPLKREVTRTSAMLVVPLAPTSSVASFKDPACTSDDEERLTDDEAE